MLSDTEVRFVDTGYGKSYVRLLYVERKGDWNAIKELEVNTRLSLYDKKDYMYGDNSKIIATDSQKNTVYILAKKLGISTIEGFAIALCQHFLTKYSQVESVNIAIDESPWQRLIQNGQEHIHGFVASGDAVRTCSVKQQRYGRPQVSAGFKELKIMKTTKSAFTNFVNDEFRSLPDMEDRIFCTVAKSSWVYNNDAIDYDKAWLSAKEAVLEVFAGSPATGSFSPSVQKTLYDAAKLVLARIPQIQKITIVFPNVHAYGIDFKKFPSVGITSDNQIFQPSDKPSGLIEGTIERNPTSKL